jgi:hypothetical protein
MRFAQLTASYAISTLMRIVMARWVHLPLAAVDISDEGINKASSAMMSRSHALRGNAYDTTRHSKIRAGFTSDGKPIGIGEIDAETPNYIIEIASGAKPGKIDQLKKLQNRILLNPDRKPVVLFAPKVVKP